jgi:hypothetical protein
MVLRRASSAGGRDIVTTGLSRDSWRGQRIGDALAVEIDDGVIDGLVEGHGPHAAQTCPDARDLSSGRLKRPKASRLRGRLRQLQDDVAVALARPSGLVVLGWRRRRFRSHSEARMAVFLFIEGFYNPVATRPLAIFPPSNTKGNMMA